jgi:hypothetical protein
MISEGINNNERFYILDLKVMNALEKKGKKGLDARK